MCTLSEIAKLQADAERFHRVMELLRDLKREHGLCQPRSRRACTHCNARDELAALTANYRGRTVIVCT